MISERYDIGDMVGEGSFGSVYVGSSKETGEKVTTMLGRRHVFEDTTHLIFYVI